jgi:hypothetical protein
VPLVAADFIGRNRIGAFIYAVAEFPVIVVESMQGLVKVPIEYPLAPGWSPPFIDARNEIRLPSSDHESREGYSRPSLPAR